MNRALRLVAIAGSVVACASGVNAQVGAIRPQYYSWEKHPILNSNTSSSDYFQYNDRFATMVRVTIDSANSTGTTPAQAADATITEILARLSEGSGTINLNNLAITIQNVGGFMPSNDPTAYDEALFSFFRDDDAGPTTSQNQDDPPVYRLYQPWMGQAVGEYRLNEQTQELEWHTGDVYTWVKDYCAALKDGIDVEQLSTVPVRFHFDYEGNIFGSSWNEEIVRQILACEQDDRWETAEVPGFPGQTMEELWQAAQDEYGWTNPNNSYRTLADVLNPNATAANPTNIPYVLWWNKITHRVLSSVMERCVYDPIKSSWPNAEILVSNYEDTTADMAVDTFGYRAVMDPSTVTDSMGQLLSFSQQNNPANLIETDEYYRGFYSLNSWGDFPNYAALSTTGGPPLLFVMSATSNFADFDAPVLYYPKPSTQSGDNVIAIANYHLQGRLYEPRDGNGDPVQETVVQAMNRTFRHNLETILNTSGRAAQGVAPWISFPGIGAIDTNDTPVGIDEIRRQLALFRSKDLREVVLWGNKQGPGQRGIPSEWNAVMRADEQVYTPSYRDYQVLVGTDGTYPNPGDPLPIMNTLRSADPETVDIAADAIGIFEGTQIVVWVDDLYPHTLGHDGRLVLECQAKFSDSADQEYASVIGMIEIWNEVLQQWEPFAAAQDISSGTYEFFTPDLTTRREWDLSGAPGWSSASDAMCDYLSDFTTCEGMMGFRFTHLNFNPSTSGFVSRYDLVQFYHLDQPAEVSSSSLSSESSSSRSMQSEAGASSPSPADFNFDGVQDATDATLFTAAWTNGERRADYNANGEIDTLDLTQFLAALGRATSAGSGGLSEE